MSPLLAGITRPGRGVPDRRRCLALPALAAGRASPQRTALVLGRLPEQLRVAYQDEWLPGYSRLDLWGSTDWPSAS
jgi:hypothetical protein